MMTFERSTIPSFVLADLYKQVVIPIETTAEKQAPMAPAAEAKEPVSNPVKSPEAPAAYKFLGKNLQRVAIIVHSPGEAFLAEEPLQLLTKMLGACKLNLGDVAIVNHATAPVNMNTLIAQLQPQKTLLFGVDPSATGLPLTFPAFKEQEYAGCTYLLAPSLPELDLPTEEGKQSKAKLWACLKKLFNV